MRFISIALLLALVACSPEKSNDPQPAAPAAANAPASKPAAPSPIQFPRDEGAHYDYPIEWWYLNSQLTDAAGKKYSFFLCKFSTGRHLVSLFDKSNGKAWTRDYYESVTASVTNLDLSSITGHWRQAATPFTYTFMYNFQGVVLRAELTAKKKPFFPGSTGFIKMGENGTSYYYSLTDLALTGTLTTGSNNVPVEVTGKGWMDHQWGKWDWVKDFTQWKWYSVKLDSGEDLMLFNLYKNKNLVNSYCGYIDAENKQFHNLACKFTTRDYFTDDHHGKWQKEVELELPDLPNSKLTLTAEQGLHFVEEWALWEGSMRVAGSFKGASASGSAFQELNRPD